MEKEILDILQSIDIKLGNISDVICRINEESCEPDEESCESKEDDIIRFLNDITKELGIENKVTIRKIEIK